MPRKRSASGRSRRSTITSNIYVQTEKINKRLRSLERGGNYGKYKGREFLTFVKDSKYLRMTRRKRLKVSKLREASGGQLILINKKFRHFLRSKGFSNVGIFNIREQTRATVKVTLKGMIGRDISDRETDMFYDIIQHKRNSILDKIPPSDFFNLVMTAREENVDIPGWITMLEQYVEINNEYLRREAEYLYYKYVKS